MKNQPKTWTREDDNLLIQMVFMGEPLDIIATALGRSQVAVMMRISRLRRRGVPLPALDKRPEARQRRKRPRPPERQTAQTAFSPPRVSREEFERRVDLWAVSLGYRPVFGNGERQGGLA